MEENLKQKPAFNKLGKKIFRIAIFGVESTGKTTLARQLAEYFKTNWVAEYAREYLEEKKTNSGLDCTYDDMLPIAIGQTMHENKSLENANDFLFCDTNVLLTKTFSDIYYKKCPALLDKYAKEHQYDLTFLTHIDVPYEVDGIRDSEEYRNNSYKYFEEALINNDTPFILLSGNKLTRLEKAIKILSDYKKANELGFSQKDFLQIYKHGIDISNIEKQWQHFLKGIKKVNLTAPAVNENGILRLSNLELSQKSNFFKQKKENLVIEKFVPASGAATRMFQFLISFLQNFDLQKDTINGYINRNNDSLLKIFILGIEKFPFYKEIIQQLKKNHPSYESFDQDTKIYYFVRTMLDKTSFDFSNKPKGVLPFHLYPSHIATAVEEHLMESILYANNKKFANIHFTISENHQDLFDELVKDLMPKIQSKSDIKINIGFSYQEKSTDTLAVDLNNEPFRTENGQLLFRPGGHGALIHNLNKINSDIIFIKNIDNVSCFYHQENTVYKQALAGILLERKEKLHHYLHELDNSDYENDLITEITNFMQEELKITLDKDFQTLTKDDQVIILKKYLDRPIRVCGMVINEGEPGGGPFWVKNDTGINSLQIVESSQVDKSIQGQINIMQSATHFNPVDLVCCIKNYKGKKFDLTQFVDHNSGFIVEKSKNGKSLKGYELPGLWNGAMADWITFFVEVPLITFNPVKTVNDLLKSTHQP